MAPTTVPASVQLDDEPAVQWDTTPLTMRKWLLALPEYLEDLNGDYVTFWEQGYAIGTKNMVLVPTASHAVALRENAVRLHSFSSPISIDIFVEQALPRNARAFSGADKERYSCSQGAKGDMFNFF